MQSTYSQNIGEEICMIIASSKMSVGAVCRELGLKERTVWHWLYTIPEFREMYELAKAQQADYYIEETIEIADSPSKGLVDAMDKKLQVAARQWAAGKLRPKRFGQNSSSEVTIDIKRPMTDDQFNKYIAGLEQLKLPQKTIDTDYEDVIERDNDETTGADPV